MNWYEAARRAFTEIQYRGEQLRWSTDYYTFRPETDEEVDRHHSEHDFVSLGAMAYMTVWKHFDFDFAEFLENKQNDYGSANINRYGPQGLEIRLWDKIARYRNLRNKGEQPHNESMVDTMMDIVGYACISIILENGWMDLPTRRQLELEASQVDIIQPDDLLYEAWALLANSTYWDHTDYVRSEEYLVARNSWRDRWHETLEGK